MFGAIARSIFGTTNDRVIKGLRQDLAAINALEPSIAPLTDEALRARTQMLRDRLAAGETEDDILVDAFATVREGAKRALGQRHFDVQMLGGMILHKGMIAEMKTGEGKTLVATLPVYLNALSGKGVHVVTVNDYLAARDSEWMGRVYRFLGLTVGVNTHEMDEAQKQAAYRCDITYSTNNELGFDYLRDNMKFRLEDMVQRPFNFGIVDEVDSILIDEARTPLIISGPTEDNADEYRAVDLLMPALVAEDFEKDEKQRSVNLTEAGVEHVETLLRDAGLMATGGMYDIHNVNLVHHANQALRAHKLFARDVDYIVKDDKVVIIDEFTGRMMEGRRYSEGLHQALEAKEHVTIQNENQTLASITFQNYFRLYPKLAGMTGTAMTEQSEFLEIYNLLVVEVPTNVAVGRKDYDDEVYRSGREKGLAIVELIDECQKRRQPVLVGTVSIEKSETLSDLLTAKGIKHQVLNARHHEQEAYIVAQAGVPGTVTIATNMAGRGTDIQLGGNVDMRVRLELDGIEDGPERDQRIAAIEAEVAELKGVARAAGGLYVIGTERHESRRIDNQLRGRSGRQGDPGASKFFLSLDDDLMRIFGSQRMDGMLQKLGLKEGEAIIHPWINKALEKAQQKVEARNFDIRKNLLKYDNVMNDQRKVVYEQRREVMSTPDVSETVDDMRHEVATNMVARHIPENAYPEQWDAIGLVEDARRVFALDLPFVEWAAEDGIADEEIRTRLHEAVEAKASEKTARYGEELMRVVEKSLLLQILDQSWKEHLLTLDHLRQGIGLRAYAQKDPLNEYKREAFDLFETMLADLRERVVESLSNLELRVDEPEPEPPPPASYGPASYGIEMRGQLGGEPGGDVGLAVQTPLLPSMDTPNGRVRFDQDDPGTWGAISRNAQCPCGSGKKYKHCHGAVA